LTLLFEIDGMVELMKRLAFLIGSVALASSSGAVTLNLADFDPACGQPQHNCRAAFQKAFEASAKAGGGTLRLPAGTFPVDFPEVSGDTSSGRPLQKSSLIAVPPNVTIEGHADTAGMPDTTIEWKATSIPVFVFANSSSSGMTNLHFRFTGAAPARYPYGDVALLRALGFNPTFPHENQMSGGNYEMSSVVMLFGSEHCTFSNLLFDSAAHDNQHVFGFAFNVKGKGLVTTGLGGGLSDTAVDNRFSNIKIYDYVMGLMVAGQENLVIENVTADRRGSSSAIAPGHLIYLTGTALFDSKGVAKRTSNKNITVRNIQEGSDTWSNSQALGTLAVKSVNGGSFKSVISHHPAGLIQSLQADQNLAFGDLQWFGDKNYCTEGGERFCDTPVIESAASAAGDPPMQGLTFRNVLVQSTARGVSVNLIGSGITVDGLTIRTPPGFRKDQTAPASVLSLRQASNAKVSNYNYVPVLSSFDSGAKYNQPFVCWGSCSNVHVDVTVKWPKSIAVPKAAERVITSGFQSRKDGDGNTVTSRIETSEP
jgi:hypothetical protein